MLRAGFTLWLGLWMLTRLNAQPIPQVAAELTARISPLLPRNPAISLELQNQSTLPASAWDSFRSRFETELRKAGVQMAAQASPEIRLRVTLSSSARAPLLVAEIVTADNRQIVMLPWNPPALPTQAPQITLTKKVLWTQPEPILDVLALDSTGQMIVMDAATITTYRQSGGNWTPTGAASLVLPRPIPRDPRGRLEIVPSGFRAYIPGATCTGTLPPDLKISCSPGNETWAGAPVRWVSDRNFLESDTIKGQFYTFANGIFAMTDSLPTAAAAWGSDIAAVDSSCGSATIASSPATDRDSVRAYQGATPVSAPLPLPGPVTALWPAETRGQVTLVIRNSETGEYEASRLGLACSQ